MGVPPDNYGTQAACDVVERESATFLGEPCVQYQLQQDVGQLTQQLVVVDSLYIHRPGRFPHSGGRGGLDRFGHFKGLFEEVLHEGCVGERPHPGAVLPQGSNHIEKLLHLPCRDAARVRPASQGWRRRR